MTTVFPIIAEKINQLLPQTQCKECGFDGCLPYANALANGETTANLCSAGGEIVARDLADFLGVDYVQPIKIQEKVLAWIDESACIGCTACIRACPVDAIMGASKFMHTVLADECTGCGLCVAPCPVDCIELHAVTDAYLPRSRHLSDSHEVRFQAAFHAQTRHIRHNQRKEREAAERRAKLAQREAAAKSVLQNNETNQHNTPKFNPNDLIAKAMNRAQSQQTQRVASNNRADFQAEQVRQAQEKATYRRAMRDAKYGNENEKAAAIEWLRAHKAEQERLAQLAAQKS